MNPCQAPQTGPLSSVAALQAWSAATADPITAGWVPLQPRAGGLPDAPRVLHCHSDMGGYLKNGDLWPQGTGNADIYLQPYWQLVDLFVYFAQTPVMIPTPWWINAAHRNGVQVLGTLCMNSFSPDEVSLFLDGPPGTPTVTLPDGTVVPFFAAQLAAVAEFYGFDGWFFDVETVMSPEQAGQLVAFLRDLTALMNAGGRLVIWYDAMTADGSGSYQNVLNEQNLPFFLATNGIFINYWWNTGAQSPTDPSRSAALAAKHERSPFDVYTGIEIFQSSTEFNGYEGQFDTWRTMATCGRAGTSSGLFAASWTYQHAADYADYLARDRRLWVGSGGCEPEDGIAAVVPPRPLPAALPIFTSFNLGNVTRAAYIDGAPQPGSAPFGNLSEQDPLPAWRFCATPSFHADVSFATDTAFNGGTSLRVLALGEARVRLFACASPVEGDLAVVYTVLDPRGVLALSLSFDGAPELVLAARTAPGRVAPTSVVDHEGGWESRVYALGGAYAGLTLTEVDLLHAGGGVSTHLGDLRIVPAGAAAHPRGVRSLAGTPLQPCGSGTVSTRLTWEAPDEPVAWYDVYCDNGARFWVGRAYANAYVAQVPAGDAASLAFTVQPVGTSGFRQPLDEAATVTLPAAMQTAGAAPWAPAVAEPV